MSNYYQDYTLLSDKDKLLILQSIYKTASKKDRKIIVEATQKLYNKEKLR